MPRFLPQAWQRAAPRSSISFRTTPPIPTKVVWRFGSYSYTQTVAAGLASASYTIPMSWLNAIPFGDVRIRLREHGDVGRRRQFAGHADVWIYHYRARERQTHDLQRDSDAGQRQFPRSMAGKSMCTARQRRALAISGAAGAYGSTIRSYSITTQPQHRQFDRVKLHDFGDLYDGTVTVTATVTDSRGAHCLEDCKFQRIRLCRPVLHFGRGLSLQ